MLKNPSRCMREDRHATAAGVRHIGARAGVRGADAGGKPATGQPGAQGHEQDRQVVVAVRFAAARRSRRLGRAVYQSA